MALETRIKSNTDQIKKYIKKYGQNFQKAIDQGLLQAGFQLVNIIRTKTKKGIDYNDKRFAAYSRGYIKRLERERKSTNVDLFYTGRMLGSLTPDYRSVKKSGYNKVTVSFNNAEMRKRALFNQVMMGDKNREFFGFNKRTESIIGKSFNEFINKQMKTMRT